MNNDLRPPKAQSVHQDGTHDGFEPPMAYRGQVLQGGYTRLEISSPQHLLHTVHQELVKQLQFPCKIRYLRLTDRQDGQLDKQESFVAVEISIDRMMQALSDYHELFYNDARHQLWILDNAEEQIVLDELGMIYVYPDDFLFRDVLTRLGWSTQDHVAMTERDYVRVSFSSAADDQEKSLIQRFGLVRWEG